VKDEPEAPAIRAPKRNRVPKGHGNEAKASAPTPWDDYDYARESPAWARLKALGKQGMSMHDVVRLGDAIARALPALTQRERIARRRKSLALH
jgi:hypothetical protein